MNRAPMFDNITGQTTSFERVIAYQTGEGRPALAEAAEAIRRCEGRVIVSGMGASYFAALPAVQSLEAAGHRVLFAEASELLHFGAGSWRTGDLAVLVSRSGGSIETLELARKLTAVGVPFIAVTNVPGSALTTEAQVALDLHSLPDKLIAIQTYTGTALMLLLLAEQVSVPGSTALLDQMSAALPLFDAHVAESLAGTEGWLEGLLGSGPLYLLGRGGALATLGEGALLLHETAKLPALAMSSGQFRHGPVEVVGPEFRAVVIGTSAATRALDWSLARDLRAMGAYVFWMGPSQPADGSSAAGAISARLPWRAEVPPVLAPLFDIVPLQAAAYAAALGRGIRPGDFRYASEITDQEAGFPLFEATPR